MKHSSKQQLIEERVLSEAYYISATSCTVRTAAKQFRVSKSTVHKDMTERLQQFSCELAYAVNSVLQVNKENRHIRGGEATKAKYNTAD